VFLNGKAVGQTPLTLRALGRSAYTVRVARDGYVAQERRVTLTASRPSQSVTVALTPERPSPAAAAAGRYTAPLVVESRPPGASVYLDGKLVGTTPLTIPDVNAGAHAIRLELAGYRRWTASARVVAGEPNRVAASLER
jgi:hypothetical protein